MGRSGSGTREAGTHETDPERAADAAFARWMEHVPAAFAVTRGAEHRLVYANAAFRRLAAGTPVAGRPIAEAFAGRATGGLRAVLDHVHRTGSVARDRRIEPLDDAAPAWCCTAWPDAADHDGGDHDGAEHDGAAYLVVELRATTETELTLALQREVAERMLLSALQSRDVADVAEASRRRAAFLAAEGRRLAGSLDESVTLHAVAGLSLPQLAGWCIVDVLDGDGAVHRLAIIHPDPAKQTLLLELEGRWSPEPGDGFGVPAMQRSRQPAVIAGGVDAAIAAAAHDPATLRILREVGVGPLLTVPLVIRDRLAGAVTFVAGRPDHVYAPEDVELAEDLAIRSAMALDSARLHGESIALRTQAELASRAKSTFLGTMSHELRTPLNAIGGYVDLLDMGLRGPVTEDQHADLARIRVNQRHLLSLINDILNLVRVGSGGVRYDAEDVAAHELLAAGVALVEPLIRQKQLVYEGIACDPAVVARADREKATQIVVNLLSNAIKFTPPGGTLAIACEATAETVSLRVADTGMGIPPDQLESIFEPFVQVHGGLTRSQEGTGLGLAISRDLARGMGGDLTAESEPGVGSTFTLSLPAAEPRE